MISGEQIAMLDSNLLKILSHSLVRFLCFIYTNSALVSLTILVTLLTMGTAIINMNHFGEGLMQKLDNPNGDRDASDRNVFELENR